MAIRDLFSGAKKAANKAGKASKRAEDKAEMIYDREVRGAVEAHKRGASEVGERFERANVAAGEYAERSFGFSDDSEFASGFMDGGVDVLGEDTNSRNVPDALGGSSMDSLAMNDQMGGSGMGDSQPGVPDLMGDDDNDDRLW